MSKQKVTKSYFAPFQVSVLDVVVVSFIYHILNKYHKYTAIKSRELAINVFLKTQGRNSKLFQFQLK